MDSHFYLKGSSPNDSTAAKLCIHEGICKRMHSNEYISLQLMFHHLTLSRSMWRIRKERGLRVQNRTSVLLSMTEASSALSQKKDWRLLIQLIAILQPSHPALFIKLFPNISFQITFALPLVINLSPMSTSSTMPPGRSVPDFTSSTPSSSVWDRVTTWASENKAVVYTIAGVAVVVTGAGVAYYLTDSVCCMEMLVR